MFDYPTFMQTYNYIKNPQTFDTFILHIIQNKGKIRIDSSEKFLRENFTINSERKYK